MEIWLWDRREAQERPARPDPMTITSVVDSEGRVEALLGSNADRAVGLVLVVVVLMLVVVVVLYEEEEEEGAKAVTPVNPAAAAKEEMIAARFGINSSIVLV